MDLWEFTASVLRPRLDPHIWITYEPNIFDCYQVFEHNILIQAFDDMKEAQIYVLNRVRDKRRHMH